MERESFESIVNLLSRNYHDKVVTDAQIDIWYEELGHYENTVLIAAASDLMRSEEFFPTLATFIEYVEKLRQIQGAIDDEFCGQCEDGWVHGPNNTVDACACSTLRQTQKMKYSKEHRQLFGRIRGPELTDYKPVSAERAREILAEMVAERAGSAPSVPAEPASAGERHSGGDPPPPAPDEWAEF